MKDFRSPACSECDGFDRRGFLRTLAVGGAALATGWTPMLLPGTARADKPMPRSPNPVAEDLVKELFAGLTDTQKKAVVKPWDHAARRSVNPNKALDKKIGDVYSKTQQELVQQIVRAIASDDKGWNQITRDGTWDASRSFENTGADIFGDPSHGKFAFLSTGHHLTLRCDGDSEEGAAFGGPIYYGHSPNGYSPRNVFAYQTEQVMRAFDALDDKQQKRATIAMGNPGEGAKSIVLKKAPEPRGIAFADLSKDQQTLFEKVMTTILSPFRQQDGAEVVSIIKKMGGMQKVHMAFFAEAYEGASTSDKQPWSFWRLEGPGFVWNFRVLPHVHTYVNIASKIG